MKPLPAVADVQAETDAKLIIASDVKNIAR